MSNTEPLKTVAHSLPHWFVVELEETAKDWDPYLSANPEDCQEFLGPALSLLPNPEATYNQISETELLIHITCDDAYIDVRVKPPSMNVMVQIIGGYEKPIRFCENLDAYVWGSQGVRELPGGTVTTSELRPSGYLFGKVIKEVKSEYQTLTLTEHPFYGKALLLDENIQIGANDESLYSGSLVSHAIPDEADSVLILGGGDCGVLREVLTRKVNRVKMVELDGAVIEFCREHFPEVVAGAPEDPRAEILIGDAFKYLRNTEERFDVVISDLLDEPISHLSLEDQVVLMKRVLKDGGRLATHSEYTELFDPTYNSEAMAQAFKNQLQNVEIIQERIPSFQDELWLFLRDIK